jgi:hypothetical protein
MPISSPVFTRMSDHSGDICGRKHGGNPESREAFKQLSPHRKQQAAKIIVTAVATPEGLTAEEFEEVLGIERSSVSARCSELRERGLLIRKQIAVDPAGGPPVYLRRRNRSGAWAAVLVWNEACDPWPWIRLLEKEMAA